MGNGLTLSEIAMRTNYNNKPPYIEGKMNILHPVLHSHPFSKRGNHPISKRPHNLGREPNAHYEGDSELIKELQRLMGSDSYRRIRLGEEGKKIYNLLRTKSSRDVTIYGVLPTQNPAYDGNSVNPDGIDIVVKGDGLAAAVQANTVKPQKTLSHPFRVTTVTTALLSALVLSGCPTTDYLIIGGTRKNSQEHPIYIEIGQTPGLTLGEHVYNAFTPWNYILDYPRLSEFGRKVDQLLCEYKGLLMTAKALGNEELASKIHEKGCVIRNRTELGDLLEKLDPNQRELLTSSLKEIVANGVPDYENITGEIFRGLSPIARWWGSKTTDATIYGLFIIPLILGEGPFWIGGEGGKGGGVVGGTTGGGGGAPPILPGGPGG
jgi:hypothetical protein